MGPVGGAVVGHDALDVDAVVSKPGKRALHEGRGGIAHLVRQKFDVSEAAGVVDANVCVFPAGASRPVDASMATGDAMSDTLKTPKLLDVEVNEVAWIGPL